MANRSDFIQRFAMPLLAAILLTAVLATHLTPARPTAPGPGHAVAAPLPTPAPSSANYHEMLGWHLFGARPSENTAKSDPAPAAAIDDANLPPASIDLKLSGIAYSVDQTRAYAILGGADGVQKQYGVGKTIKDDIVIERIRPRSVVLKHAGRLEALTLPQESTSKGVPPSRYSANGLPPGLNMNTRAIPSLNQNAAAPLPAIMAPESPPLEPLPESMPEPPTMPDAN